MIFRVIILAFCVLPLVSQAFNFQSLFQPTTKVSSTRSGTAGKAEINEILSAVSNTGNGKLASLEQQASILKLVACIEKDYPASIEVLENPAELKKLGGCWYLQYTSPSVLDNPDQFPDAWKPDKPEPKIETKRFGQSGAVNAAGIKVDTSSRVVKQIIDVEESVVTNEVELDWGKVEVSGPFCQSENDPRRALVSFKKADISPKAFGGLTIKLGFVFDILALIRGTDVSGWLETTYLDEKVRIGRGNKGSMFVLTRDRAAVMP
eukprot:CAMPEP_0113938842 /NCGR_PEP_ID=MMETSP1339-20121228/5252_1 /TAXON_ID=94617 /ORGANISM="Fibrocapsa japonica" /LENGTH=263 /DNA_ID=CAMNT_0000942133 /DNA_START=200 /DNA_END=991 /DNA_ORIENTATION=- /assembly_acc=CAM_ASM_000762